MGSFRIFLTPKHFDSIKGATIELPKTNHYAKKAIKYLGQTPPPNITFKCMGGYKTFPWKNVYEIGEYVKFVLGEPKADVPRKTEKQWRSIRKKVRESFRRTPANLKLINTTRETKGLSPVTKEEYFSLSNNQFKRLLREFVKPVNRTKLWRVNKTKQSGVNKTNSKG